MPAIQVPLKMVQNSRLFTTATPTEELASETVLDTAKYDGNPTYTFVAVLHTSSGSETATIEIREKGSGTTLASVTHAGTLTTRKEVSVTPTAGSHAYTVWYSITGGATGKLCSAQIVVTQDTTATKTEYLIPLFVNNSNGFMNVSGGPSEQGACMRWLYTASKWANATFTLESVGNRGASGTLTVDLHDGTSVVGSTTHSSATSDLQTGSVTPTDAAEHTLRVTASSGTDVIGRAALRVTITTLSKCEVYWLVAGREKAVNATTGGNWSNSTTSTDVQSKSSRNIVDLTKYGNIAAVYGECIAQSAAASGDSVSIQKDGSNDSGATGTAVATLSITSASKQRIRSSDLVSGFANERYLATLTKGVTAGDADAFGAWLILEYVAAGNLTFLRRVMHHRRMLGLA